MAEAGSVTDVGVCTKVDGALTVFTSVATGVPPPLAPPCTCRPANNCADGTCTYNKKLRISALKNEYNK